MTTYLMGDIHGSSNPIKAFYKRNKERLDAEDNMLILLGDECFNYYLDERDKNVKKKLNKYPFIYFCLRGNHDCRPSDLMKKYPESWELHTIVTANFKGTVIVEKEFPYIWYALDHPARYIINGFDVLTFPGAYSVDKYHRIAHGWTYFENEQMNEEERQTGRELADPAFNTDIVLSHTCPTWLEPTDLFLSFIDQNMVDKTTERYLSEIEFNLDYKAWFFGHYHHFRDYPTFDGRYKCMLFNDWVLDLNEYMKGEINKL